MMTKIREGYKETEIGVIPEDWEAIELSNISDLITKGTTPTTYGFEFVDEGVNFIKIESINDTYGTLIPSSFSKITNECHQKLNRSILKSGDILFAIAGATVGKCAMIKNEELPANTNQALAIIRLKENENKQFVFHQLRGYYIQQKISQIKTNTAQPNLNLKQIGDFKFAYPKSTCEQQRIAEILSTTDSHIEKLDKTIEDYQLLKKGMMKKLLTEGIGHTDFKETEIGRIPKDWEVKKLGELIDLRTGFPFKSKEFKLEGGKYKLLRGINISEGFIRWNSDIDKYWDEEFDKIDEFKVKVGDLVISMDGSKVGRNYALLKKQYDNLLLVQRVALIRSNELLRQEYLVQIIASSYFVNYVDAVKTSSGIPHISAKQIRDFQICLPSLAEQNQISGVLMSVNGIIDKTLDERQDFILLKEALMDKLLTGKVRVL